MSSAGGGATSWWRWQGDATLIPMDRRISDPKKSDKNIPELWPPSFPHRHKPRPNEKKPLPPLLPRPFRDQPVICVDLTRCCSLTFSQRYRVTLCLSLFTWALAPPLCLPHQSGGGEGLKSSCLCQLSQLIGSVSSSQEVTSWIRRWSLHRVQPTFLFAQ